MNGKIPRRLLEQNSFMQFPFINTPLQRGGSAHAEGLNRFSGLHSAAERDDMQKTAKALALVAD